MAKKYKRKLNIKINSTFHSLVDKHMAADHQKLAVQYPYLGKPKNSPQKLPKASLGSLSQSLLDIGKDMADHYKNNPNDARKDLTFNQIFKAQDSLTKRMEVEVQQSALKLQMAKLFSGQLPEELQIEEGELVDESEESLISLLQETTD